LPIIGLIWQTAIFISIIDFIAKYTITLILGKIEKSDCYWTKYLVILKLKIPLQPFIHTIIHS